MTKTASLHNLGCKVNAYEAQAMEQLLTEAGYEIRPFGEAVDVCIINTCSVTNVADKKSRQMLHRARMKNPEAIVVAAGCYVQAAAAELKQDGAVDILIGNNQKNRLISIIDEYRQAQDHREHVIDIAKTSEYEPLNVRHLSSQTRAFIKVQDGCNLFCTYCIIPYTRGRVRSRGADEVAAEITELVGKGFKEVVLTGIHLSSYGVDLGQSPSAPQSLLGLIRRIHEIKGLERIRLGSLEPRIITAEFARELASLKKVCPHFHLSLQSGSAAVLKRMNRRYTPAEYQESCRILRSVYENPALTTDVIVGFPSETQQEFEETKAFAGQIGFYEMHVFKYSRRQGTRAAAMAEQIPEPVKNQRSNELLALNKQMSQAYRESFIGKTTRVLLEEQVEIKGKTYLTGYNGEYVKMALPVPEKDWARQQKGRLVTGQGQQLLDQEQVLFAVERKN